MKKVDIYNKNNISNKRLIVTSVFIIIFFLIISYRLYDLQIIKQKYYSEKLNTLKVSTVYSSSTPRGRIYDRNYNLLVDNVGVNTIYFKKNKKTNTDDIIKNAYFLASNIEIDYSKNTEDILKDFYLINNKELCNKKITSSEYELLKERKLTSKDILKLKKERITADELSKYNDIDKKAAYMYYLMTNGYYYDEKIIKTNATDKEYALVAENLNNLSGINIKLEWERKYLYGDIFKTILGSVSDSKSGLPYELKDSYLKKGYSLNDRVGISYLEFQYEEYLKGTKTEYTLNPDNSYTVKKNGIRGNDIVLTIDINMQMEVEKILEEEILNAKKNDINTTYYNGSHVIITKPGTGEILAMASKQVVEKNGDYKIYDNTPALLTNPVTPGSIVKGASMSVGYKYNAIDIGTKFRDECVKIRNTPAKCSWSNSLGTLDDIGALAYSSNGYQFKVALKVSNAKYYYNGPMIIEESAFDKYRELFKEYGLGIKTNIDLPVESVGYMGTSKNPGHLLDFTIGQYDTYTPIQISSYINTLASNGNRFQLHLLKEVHDSTEGDKIGKIKLKYDEKILNKVSIDDKYIYRIKDGFESVMNHLGYGYMGNVYDPCGKTGTSESFYDTNNDGKIDVPTISKGFIGFAPKDNPKISIVVLSPNVRFSQNSEYTSPVNNKISARVSNKMFEILK